MRIIPVLLLALAALAAVPDRAPAQPISEAGPRITWEVKNRFRLFREEKDFLLHTEALQGRDVLQSEQFLAVQSEGRGWARHMLGRLCIDAAGRIADPCPRDGVAENYLAPSDHAISLRVDGAPDATCTWLFDQGAEAKAGYLPCQDEIRLRVPAGRSTIVTADVRHADGTLERVSAEIAVRDFLIAGLGDSIAAGEGNPDRPIALSDDGFCFRQFIGTSRSEYFRPGRAGFKGDKSCELSRPGPDAVNAWNRLSARWQNSACHRSLYSYQLRTALALAVEQPHVAVTFLPLACTGSTIEDGVLGTKRVRETDCGDTKCPSTVPAQVTQLTNILARARKADPNRTLDLVLLTVGANDIDFSGLVADVIIEEPWSRALFKRGGVLGSVANSQALLDQTLPGDFARLRKALKPLVGGDLKRVVFTSYANPVLTADGATCTGGRDGFDVHPAFGADAARLETASNFVQRQFLPRLKGLATCTGGALCGAGEAMTFVDAHQDVFVGHGMCARAASDPAFDNACFSPEGKSFAESPVEGARQPLTCGQRPSAFRAYAPRMRWIRTANDSYFAAMTYPQGSSMQPSDIHDAMWGVLSAVYGGAVHPTAEGHAAMADAAMEGVRRALALARPGTPVIAGPLPAPSAGEAQ